MRTFTSADAKNNFGELIDLARAAPVAVTKYDRPVIVVMAIEEYQKLIQRKVTEQKKTTSKAPGKRK